MKNLLGEVAEVVLAEPTKSSFHMHLRKSLEMVVDLGRKPIFLFLCPQFISKVDPALPEPAMTLLDGLYLGQYYRYGCEILTKSLFKSLNCSNEIWDRYILHFGNYVLFSIVENLSIFGSFLS